MKKSQTNKLFYNKFLYKLDLTNTLAPIFRNKNLAYAKKVLDQLQQQYEKGLPLSYLRAIRQSPVIQENFFLDARNLFHLLQKDIEYTLRIESSHMAIFSNDESFIQECMSKVNKNNIREYFYPNPEYIGYLKNQSNIIITETPVDYEYKVTLGPKTSADFAKFAENNQDKIRIGKTALDHIRVNGYTNGYYFYARDEKVLLLCNMIVGNSVRRIDRLVYKADLDK